MSNHPILSMPNSPRTKKPPLAPERLAALDVGTNTIRCIVVEAGIKGEFRVLDDERAMVRLGEGLSATGEISPAAWERAREALLRMKKIAEGFGVVAIEAVATSAVRSASNGAAFVTAMEQETGVRIKVISGQEEAELAALSAWHHFDMENTRYVLLDIGGGSAEIVTAVGNHIEGIYSLDLGAVVLSEQFLRKDPLPKKAVSLLRRHIRRETKRSLPSGFGEFATQKLIGSGGTVTSIGSMIMAMRKERYDSVHGYEVLRSEVVHLLAMLERKTQKELRSVPGLTADRTDIIVAGVAVVDVLMEHFGINVLQINERGIREGLILRILRDHGLLSERHVPRDWRTCIQEFARSCHVDWAHAEQVRSLALSLFDALASPYRLEPRDRDVLEAAALLHDVGYFISYARHHKHSYHLIRHADLFDFNPRERELIAIVARYHRKALPKRKHEGFGDLSGDDQLLVRRLGGILRLADGLDRRRNSTVSDIACELDDSRCRVTVSGDGDLSVELYGGQEKSDLFEAALGLRLTLVEEKTNATASRRRA